MKFWYTNRYALCLLILISQLLSCQDTSVEMSWKKIDFDEISTEAPVDQYFGAITRYKFTSVINFNKDVFILLGNDSGENPTHYHAITYSTSDFGKSWTKNILGKGTVKEGLFVGTEAFLTVDKNKSPNASKRASTLYNSKDFGQTWNPVYHIENGNIFSVDFVSPTTGIAIISTKKNDYYEYRYMKTDDGGKTWTAINIDPKIKSILKDSKTLLYSDNRKIVSYDLSTNERKSTHELDIPQNMEIAYFKRDAKTKEIIAYFFSKEPGEMDVSLYFTGQKELISLPPGYFVNTFGNQMYGLLYDKPFSKYVYSDDFGKSWKTAILNNLLIYSDIPSGYFGDGYVYVEGAPVGEKGTYLLIGNPDLK